MLELMLLIKSMFTVLVFVIVIMYWKHYGPQNFLWASDVGLFMTLGALWLESPLLISMCIVAFLPIELVWSFDFFRRLITGKQTTTIADYMFESRYSLFLRSLSLFHVILPPLWVWLTIMWGYDNRALFYAIPMIWAIIIATYLLTDPRENINWVFMPIVAQWKRISMISWLIMQMIGYPLLVCLPTHMLFAQWCKAVCYYRA